MGHNPPHNTNEEAQFLPVTPTIGPTDTNYEAQFLPWTPMIGHNSPNWHQRWGFVFFQLMLRPLLYSEGQGSILVLHQKLAILQFEGQASCTELIEASSQLLNFHKIMALSC